MLKETLNSLINDPKVLYIYEIGLQIYGLFEGINDRDFLIIVSDDCDYSDVYEKEYTFKIIKIKDWFDKVLNGSILAWECACLPKKYILKEHVKLLLQTNPLQLRKDFDNKCKHCISNAKTIFAKGNTLTSQKMLWGIVKDVMFINQIIENHKILNFKEPNTAYHEIVDGQCEDWDITFDIFYKYLVKHRDRLREYTDGALKMSKLKRINQDG